MDILTWIWAILNIALWITIATSYVHRTGLTMPVFVKDFITWGKTRQPHTKVETQRTSHATTEWLLVPRRWFTHFYILGSILMPLLLYSLIKGCSATPSGYYIMDFLSKLRKNSEPPTDDCFAILVTMILISFQCLRRLWESLFVTTYSGKIHLGHYVVGMTFYTLIGLSIMVEASPRGTRGWCQSCVKVTMQSIRFHHLLAVTIFAWASYHQYQCHKILGNLTAWSQSGTKQYKIPYGDWFEYVASPHYFAEIIIYIDLFFILLTPNTRTVQLVFFVICNLGLGATITHEWYNKKFKSYPQRRKRLIPHLY